MTDVYGGPEKAELRNKLFQAAIDALQKDGWKVERIPRAGKASVRRITKGGVVKAVSIRTSQDQWIAFLRNKSTGQGWKTLDDVDYVIASTVDDRDNPQFAQIHMIDAAEMRDRFDRSYTARKAAGHKLPIDRGMWISLYDKELPNEPSYVGAGAGLDHPAIYRVPLSDLPNDKASDHEDEGLGAAPSAPVETPLTIAEAKRRLALAFGVNEADIKITISS